MALINNPTNSLPAQLTADKHIKEFPADTEKDYLTQIIGNNDVLSYQDIKAAFGELCGKVENADLTEGATHHFS